MNYGETLAYWYFRLNGFFPLIDYVLHGESAGKSCSADCDLLAIRHPYVYEDVGGMHDDWDTRFSNFGIELHTKIAGAIIEVKTGKHTSAVHDNIEKSFSEKRLKYAIKRLGFWPPDESEEVARRLKDQPHIVHNGFCIFKLAIADPPLTRKPPHWHVMTLKEVDMFILSDPHTLRA